MKIWKINKEVKLHIYSNGVIRIFHKHKGKWICIKFTYLDVLNLKYIFNSVINNDYN